MFDQEKVSATPLSSDYFNGQCVRRQQDYADPKREYGGTRSWAADESGILPAVGSNDHPAAASGYLNLFSTATISFQVLLKTKASEIKVTAEIATQIAQIRVPAQPRKAPCC
jgi:hypothetical protein